MPASQAGRRRFEPGRPLSEIVESLRVLSSGSLYGSDDFLLGPAVGSTLGPTVTRPRDTGGGPADDGLHVAECVAGAIAIQWLGVGTNALGSSEAPAPLSGRRSRNGLKRITPSVAEIQRMYVQPRVRGVGAGRLLLQQLLSDARAIGYEAVRLESLKFLSAAHALYKSVGFAEIAPYAENSMKKYQPLGTMDTYRSSAVFMELRL